MESSSVAWSRPCRHCGCEVPLESRMCLQCGGEVPRAAILKVPRCPRCSCQLDPRMFRDNDLDMCPSCSGVWCGNDEFRRLTTERDCFADESIPRDFVRPPLPVDRSPYLPCPTCGELMARQNFKSLSNVLIDWCCDHGVWLDAGEMEKIRCFIANGGLQASQDLEIRRNRTQLESLAQEFRDADFSRRVMQRKGIKSWFFS